MKTPQHFITRLIKLEFTHPTEWPLIGAKLKQIPGIAEATFIPEEKIAYVRMEKAALNHPDFLSLEEAVQSHQSS
jgi:hypothetical protein